MGALMKSFAGSKSLITLLSGVLAVATVLVSPADAARVVKPGKVLNVKVVAGNRTVALTWTKGSGGTPTSYLATLNPGSRKCTTTRTACAFTSLTNGTKYTISIVAKNSAGTGIATVITATPKAPTPTPTPTPSDTPRALTITGTISGTLTEGSSSSACSSYALQSAGSPASSATQCSLRVAAIQSNGQMFTSTSTSGSKAFTIQVASLKSAQTNLTLHIVRSDGSYVGPVLVKTGGYTGITATTSPVALGTITLQSVDVDPSSKTDNRTSYAQTSTASSAAGTLKVRLNGNAPAGAGKAGFVASASTASLRLKGFFTSASHGTSFGTTTGTPTSSPTSRPEGDPCPQLGPGNTGTLSTSCYNSILMMLSQDPATAMVKTALETACKNVAGNSSATYEWIIQNAPTCGAVLKQIMDSTGGNGGGSGGGTGQGPCPNFDQNSSGTFTQQCMSNFSQILGMSSANATVKTNLESKCASVTSNSGATFNWIKTNNSACFDALMQAFNAISGGSNGGGTSGGGSGGGSNGGGYVDPCSSVNPGSDPDTDGIPNALDVDDNGDLIIDAADPAANNGCSIEPMKGIWTAIESPLNYGLVNLSGETYSLEDFKTSINDYLSGPNFGIGYYVHNTRFFPDAYLSSAGEMPAVWVNCDGIVWCDPKTSRATLSTFSEQTNAVDATGCNPSGFFDFSCNRPFNASDYFGGTDGFADSQCGYVADQSDRSHNVPCWSEIKVPLTFGSATNSNCQSNTFNPDFSLPSGWRFPSDASNFFWRQSCQMQVQSGQTMLRTVMGAGINPEINKIDPEVLDGALAQDILSPLNVLSLRYFNKSGGVSSVATTIGAYPITGPLVSQIVQGQTSTDIDYTSTGDGLEKPLGAGGNGGGKPHAIVIQPGEKLTVTFYRPQRQAFPGEDATTGFHDVHGLSYGLEFNMKNMQIGCGASKGNPDYGNAEFPSSYDAPSSDFTLNASLDSGANALAPLRDAVKDSPTEQPASETLTITLDIAKCFQDRAELLKTMYNNTGYSFASGTDVLQAMELPEGAPTDGTATNWASATGLPNNGDTTCITMNLNGRSEAKTGGTDSSLQQMCVQFAPGSLVSQSQPSTLKAPNLFSAVVGYLKKAQLVGLNTP